VNDVAVRVSDSAEAARCLDGTVAGPSRGVHPGSCLSLLDLGAEDQAQLVSRARSLGQGSPAEPVLQGKAAGVFFTKTSTRTRTSFTVGTIRLGGFPIAYGPSDLQLGTGESLADTGRVFGSMLDLLIARTAGPQADLATLAEAAGIPVINAMTAEEHPTQAIGDLALIDHRVGLPGVKLLYIGEGNNTAVALAYALASTPEAQVTFVTPSRYGLPAEVLAAARARAAACGSDATLRQTHDLDDLPEEVDIVYTTRWQTTGTSKPDAHWREDFWPYRVDRALLDRWPAAWFMHDLPAHRGDEVASEVLDGPRSLAWEQAGMKLYGAMAVLERAATTGRG
jgi:ornithine carbamoyltransferase